ncbi:MAG: WhiB family transcriptional regulator [Carbonactinosporaceae bacterium]
MDGRIVVRLWKAWAGASDRVLRDVVNDDAACRDEWDVMYPDPSDLFGIVEARSVCARCPVQAECLLLALRTGETDGVWGGLMPAERRVLWESHLSHLATRQEGDVSGEGAA